VTHVLVESGPGLLETLLGENLVCELLVYIAPMLMGDGEALPSVAGMVTRSLDDARRFRLVRTKRVVEDVEIVYRRQVPGE
jgi:riboflavin biosynthesis pyrimidine reductase